MVLLGFGAGGTVVRGGGESKEVDQRMQRPAETSSGSPGDHPRWVHTNRLAGETSPYLLQHAHNPVDWYPWGEEALNRAKTEDKPIFLSIGYSACHWCHVMERESFEDVEVAKLLNASVISIKVDREERPDLDEIYMTAVQMMTGSGGWPLNVFLTPDLQPFYGGTYFPPHDRYGRPSFKKVVGHIVRTWNEEREKVSGSAEKLTQAIRGVLERDTSRTGPIDATVLSRATDDLERVFDSEWGGFGRAPKFPPSAAIGLLLRQHAHTGEEKLLEMATLTLDRMARGGMYDQLGGGFHRYSTDDRWLVPHFEKMLYDNALLARAYLEAWQVTGKQLYRRIATETLDYVLRDMTDREGGFHSSEDADSEGEEGKFYVWTPDEIKEVLGAKDGALFCEYYDVTAGGNYEGHSILNVPRDPAEFARGKGLSLEELENLLSPQRTKLFEVRSKRVRPAKDDKIIAAWNGMMISAFVRGYQVLGEERFLKGAERAADFVATTMVRDGVLLRTCRVQGGEEGECVGGRPAYLDDYAEMTGALIDLYEATFDLRRLATAESFAQRILEDFWDEPSGGFFYTSASHKNLLARTKPYYDGAEPSGNSTAALVLLRLSELLDNADYREKGESILASARGMAFSQPRGHLNLLWAADFFLYPTREIAIAGKPDGSDTRRLLGAIHGRFIPNKVVALVEPDTAGAEAVVERIPLLRYKRMISDKATVYVCRDHNCKLPVTDEASLAKILDTPDDALGTKDERTSIGGSP